jgi:hypothetical protein
MSAAACVSMFAVGGVEMSASACVFSVCCLALLKRLLPMFPRLLLIVSKAGGCLCFSVKSNQIKHLFPSSTQ